MDTLPRKDGWILLVLWVFWSTLFFIFPSIDLTISAFFYDPAIEGFPLKNSSIINHLNNIGRWLIVPLALWPLILVWLPTISFNLTQAALYVVFYTVSTFVLVEYGVKEIWLRPRPMQIVLFGGTQPFLVPFHSLPRGDFHSFVSGHTAVWFGLICIGYTLYPRQCRFWTLFSIFTGAGMAYLRICIGEHFLSDTIFAGLFVCSACVILERLVGVLKRFIPCPSKR